MVNWQLYTGHAATNSCFHFWQCVEWENISRPYCRYGDTQKVIRKVSWYALQCQLVVMLRQWGLGRYLPKYKSMYYKKCLHIEAPRAINKARRFPKWQVNNGFLFPHSVRLIWISVTRLGDFYHFGNFLNSLANILGKISPKVSNILGNFLNAATFCHLGLNMGSFLPKPPGHTGLRRDYPIRQSCKM